MVSSALFRDLVGRLAVLLHITLLVVAFGVSVACFAADAAWWRSTALSDSYAVCHSATTETETAQLCAAFTDDLTVLLRGYAIAIAVLCMKLSTAVGALCCGEKLALRFDLLMETGLQATNL